MLTFVSTPVPVKQILLHRAAKLIKINQLKLAVVIECAGLLVLAAFPLIQIL